MDKLVILAALICQSGDRLMDISAKIPRGSHYLDIVISVKPFYSRIYIYEIGFPESIQQCCGNKPTSVLRVPLASGRFCIRQSQAGMEWEMRALLKPDVAL